MKNHDWRINRDIIETLQKDDNGCNSLKLAKIHSTKVLLKYPTVLGSIISLS